MVFRRAEYCRPRPVDMVLAAVDELLRMLDPAAHLEGFEVGGDSRPAQRPRQFPSAEPRSNQHCRSLQNFAGTEPHAGAAAAGDHGRGNFGAEAEGAAEFDDPPAQVGRDDAQVVRTDMRAFLPADLRRRSRFDEGAQDETGTAVFGAGVELAVGKGPRAAFADQQIAVGIEFAALQHGLILLVTRADFGAAVEDHRFGSGQRQRQRREDASGPGADHDRMAQHGFRRQFQLREPHGADRLRLQPFEAGGAGSAVVQFQDQRVDQRRPAAPGVDALAGDEEIQQRPFRQVHRLQHEPGDFPVDVGGSLGGADLEIADRYEHDGFSFTSLRRGPTGYACRRWRSHVPGCG